MTIHRVKPLNPELKKIVLKKLLLRQVLQTVESDAAERLLQLRLVAYDNACMVPQRITSISSIPRQELLWSAPSVK